MSDISIIVAIADNGAIGKDNNLLCHMPADMRRFKALTTGHAVIMGRRTFESLPRALPNRKNIVLTHATETVFTGCLVCQSMSEALALCEEGDETFIMGGAVVYQQGLEIAHKMYITRIHHAFPEATTYFPTVDWEQWEEVERETHEADEKNPYPYTYITYTRKKR